MYQRTSHANVVHYTISEVIKFKRIRPQVRAMSFTIPRLR